MNKQLILLEKKVAFSKLPSIIKQDDLCYFFSKDYLSYIKLNKIIPDDCKVLNLTGKFNSEIERLMKEYLNLFTDLSKKHDSLEWWSSQIASRNSCSTSLQLNITYLFCAKKIIHDFIKNQNQKRLIFISDSQALLDSISILCSKKNIDVFQPRKRLIKALSLFRLFFLYMYRVARYLFRSFKNKILAFLFSKPLSGEIFEKQKIIIIRSWITKGTLNQSGIYKDRNFGDLPHWLQSNGYKVIILPMFFNLMKTLKETYLLMNEQNIAFLNQYHYLRLIDYIKTIYMEWKQINIPFNMVLLEGLDLRLIFREIQLEQGFALSGLSPDLSYHLLRRIKDRGIRIIKFYYPFENNIDEKLFILGCKKYFPDSEVIGYQHTAWHKNQLGSILGRNEAEFHPIADKIICSGPIYIDVLKKAGFPKNILVSGPNLRYTSVHKVATRSKQNIIRPNILLLLTFDLDLACDLIQKIKLISKDFPKLFIYIRRHPLINCKELESFLNEINMVNFKYADTGSIQDQLLNTDIVISSGASIANVETIVTGVPLIRVEPDNDFFLDPLAWSDYPIKPVNSLDEIRNAINSILGMEKEDKDKIQAIGKDVLFNYFTQINDNTMKVFN